MGWKKYKNKKYHRPNYVEIGQQEIKIQHTWSSWEDDWFDDEYYDDGYDYGVYEDYCYILGARTVQGFLDEVEPLLTKIQFDLVRKFAFNFRWENNWRTDDIAIVNQDYRFPINADYVVPFFITMFKPREQLISDLLHPTAGIRKLAELRRSTPDQWETYLEDLQTIPYSNDSQLVWSSRVIKTK